MERGYPIPKREMQRLVTRELFTRQDVNTSDCDLSCPDCPSGQACVLVTPSEPVCPVMECSQVINLVAEDESSGPGIGPIIGAVVGGIALIAITTYLYWRYCVKPKRKQYAAPPKHDEASDSPTGTTDREKAFARKRDQRSSTHTVHSIASTVLTRASNIIQIAYIPGVTNRTTPTSASPTVLVPPVPPLPLSLSNASSPSPHEEPHFFVPGDLRDSTYSGFSGYTDRTSVARTSYAARTSMAPSIASAIISPPPITGVRGKAAIVSLKSPVGSYGGLHTPPVPSINMEKYGKSLTVTKPPPSPGGASTFSVGSTFLNNASASTATQVRPQIVRVGSKSGKANPLTIKKIGSAWSTSPDASTKNDSSSTSRGSTMSTGTTARDSAAVTIIDDSPSERSPFSDPLVETRSNASLSAVIEEATRRAARTDTRPTETQRERSPFSDEHATND